MNLKRATTNYIYKQLVWFDFEFKKTVELTEDRLTKLSKRAIAQEKRLFDLEDFNAACERSVAVESILHKPEAVINDILNSVDYIDMKITEHCATWVRLQLYKRDRKELRKLLVEARLSKDKDLLRHTKEAMTNVKNSIKQTKHEYKMQRDKLETIMNNKYLNGLEDYLD